MDVASKEETSYLVTDLSSKLEKATSERTRWETESKELRGRVEEYRVKEGERVVKEKRVGELESQLTALNRCYPLPNPSLLSCCPIL